MKALKIPTLLLAAALQLVPIARVATVVQQSATPLLAIIFRWGAAAAAALGGMEAVSGASTVITSVLAAKGTNGVPFKSLRLTTAPDQAHFWTASGLPTGLNLTGTAGSSFWQIAGTPKVSGTFNVLLTAKDQSNSGADRTIRGTLVLTIIAVGSPPTITLQPQSQTVTAGANVAFTVNASGTSPLTYQWKKDGVSLRGETTSTLSLNAVGVDQSGQYFVLVSNALGTATSDSVSLVVNAIPPAITTQPQSRVVNVGDPVAFGVVAEGTVPMTYQWFFNGSEIAGATAPSFTISNANPSAAGSYSVVVANSGGNVTSDIATLTVNSLATTPVIVTPPKSQDLYFGDTARFSVDVTGSEPLTYQWFFNGSTLSNANIATLTLTNVQSAQAGSYTVWISNSGGSVISEPVLLNAAEAKIDSFVPVSAGWQISWQGLMDRVYEVQDSQSLASNAWITISMPPPPPTNGEMIVSLSNSENTAVFYRVRVQPVP